MQPGLVVLLDLVPPIKNTLARLIEHADRLYEVGGAFQPYLDGAEHIIRNGGYCYLIA
jgi:hypothetical protein